MTSFQDDTRRPAATARLGGAFQRFWAAHTSANLGDGILLTLLPLMAAAVTTDPLMVSLLTVSAYLPWVLFGLHAGAFVDRTDKRRVMVVANVLRCVFLGLLMVLVWAGATPIWTLCLFAFALALCEVLHDGSARALLPVLVPRPLLPSANSRLEGARILASDFVGGPVASLLFVAAPVFAVALNAGTYLVGGLLLLAALPVLTRPLPSEPSDADGEAQDGEARDGEAQEGEAREGRGSLTQDAVSGLRFVWGDRIQRGFTVTAAMSAFATGLVSAILVLYVTRTLGVSEAMFGVYTAVAAVGAVISALVCGPLIGRLGAGWVLVGAYVLASVSLVALGVFPDVYVGAAALGLFGFSGTAISVSAVSTIQAVTPVHVLGRAGMTRALLTHAAVPVGALTGGVLGWTGLQVPFVVAGLLLLMVPALFWRVIHEASARAAETP
ncbi:MFS transporter [Nocardiopsis terrae]|uniref:MFS family permease n=1 Tax=Nocardiopsis terrae TaxID=372655 RepID=A0ABR9HE37_9ACTN|nr:MFS transporter [Nocardiopsis terrae]MBE1457296.1 MFS family permease [Nocardiopsis terrae]GHC91609.1 MFS transporter [Nocardiopsis terrae]